MDYTVDELKKMGEKLSMSFSQILSLYFYEEILERISRSDLKNKMWLKLEDKRIENHLIFYMDDILKEKLEVSMKDILKNKLKQHYKIEWGIWYKDEEIEIVLSIQLDKVQVPFKIIVRLISVKDVYPGEAVYISVLDPGRKISYKEYPMELHLSECFYEIMDKLELIGDMLYYDKVYQFLQQHTADGRRVRMDFVRLLERKPIPSVSKRWDTVISYKEYGYMKKKWKSYHKGSKKEIPNWEDVIDLLDAFFSPIWKSIENDEIFVGDWMPNLGRYLD